MQRYNALPDFPENYGVVMTLTNRPRRLLHLDSSPRRDGCSRKLTQRFVTIWQQANPQAQILYRDIGQQPIPHLDEIWVAAYETDPQDRSPEMREAITLSDQLIDELIISDCYVFGIPMYNLSVPSTFKAYIDQIVRRDRTVSFQDGIPHGALKDKKILVITTRKFSYRADSGRAERDFQTPFLRAIFAVIGITDVSFIHADHLAAEPAIRQTFLTEAEQTLEQLALHW